jgi:hypothetical protein
MPSQDTSARKLKPLWPVAKPESLSSNRKSVALTIPSPLTSPNSTPKVTLSEASVPLMPSTSTVRSCTSVTSVSDTVMVSPLKVTSLTVPVPSVTSASPETTGCVKVKTSCSEPLTRRHSTPSVPVSGRGIA